MLRRLASLALLMWLLGFLMFSVTLPGPVDGVKTDAVLALTGGEGRIERALAVMRQGAAGQLLVSGVDSEVKPAEFAAHYHVPPAEMRCCVTLGYRSVDTRSNATEAAGWVASHGITSLRLVTSDWHMRRAAFELRRALPPNIVLVEDAVPTQPSFRGLFIEYNKLVARRLLALWRH